jgi:hypothetical protein
MELKVFEYVEKKNEYSSLEDNNSSWTPNADAVLDGLKMSPNEKVCDTVHKITIQTAAKKNLLKSFMQAGSAHLEPIKLYYCSTVGLILAKVLESPPRPRPVKSSNEEVRE